MIIKFAEEVALTTPVMKELAYSCKCELKISNIYLPTVDCFD